MHRIINVIDKLNNWIGKSVSWLLLAMVLIGAFNAIARFLGKYLGVNLSSNMYLELQWYLFSIVFLAGAAYTLYKDSHVRVDVLYDHLSPKKQAWLNLIGNLTLLIPFCIFALIMSYKPVIQSWSLLEQSPDPNGLPRYIIKSVIPIGFFLLLLQGISQVLKNILTIRAKEEST